MRDNLKRKTGVYPLLKLPDDKTSMKFKSKDKADILQNQFCSVFTREPNGGIPEFASRTDKEIEISITVEMIKKEIRSINVNKSIGPDEIHPKMLKELVDHISEPLWIIMEKSLNKGVLPDDWKTASVSPIYKNKGAKDLAVNYRPISLTSIACRITEKLLKNQIMDHLMEKNLLSNKHHGLVNKRSTEPNFSTI